MPRLGLLVLSACTPSGPPSTDTVSAALPDLAARRAFLRRYLVVDRRYEQLEYRVVYHNNAGGWVPGPSEWDICLLAQVPAPELAQWIAGLTPVAPPAGGVPDCVPVGTIERSGIATWYQDGPVLVGVDQRRAVVFYRNSTR